MFRDRRVWLLLGWAFYLWMLLMLHGCIDIPKPNVTVDNVIVEIPINEESCPGVYAASLLCYVDGYVPPEAFIDILKEEPND